jgi:Na+/phosphate symporter
MNNAVYVLLWIMFVGSCLHFLNGVVGMVAGIADSDEDKATRGIVNVTNGAFVGIVSGLIIFGNLIT